MINDRQTPAPIQAKAFFALGDTYLTAAQKGATLVADPLGDAIIAFSRIPNNEKIEIALGPMKTVKSNLKPIMESVKAGTTAGELAPLIGIEFPPDGKIGAFTRDQAVTAGDLVDSAFWSKLFGAYKELRARKK